MQTTRKNPAVKRETKAGQKVKYPAFMVVIGASAGGLNALMEMVQSLQKGLDVAYCIVLHLSRKGIGDFIVHRLSQVSCMPCSMAVDGAPIKKDNIYIARPNQHLLVKDNKFWQCHR